MVWTKVILLVLVVLQICIKDVHLRKLAQCGVPKITKTQLILHGYESIPGAWPWHAAVYHRKRLSDVYACGGTLVSEQYVLTAAHCVLNTENGYQVSNKNIFIRLGVFNLQELIRNSVQQHSIQKIHKHVDYSSDDIRNDIALLELATVAEFSDYVQPACLGLTKDLTGELGTVIGWGRTESEEVSPTLRSARMPVIDVLTCLESDRAVFGETLSKGILCAGYTNGTGVCNGDSGSGLFFQQKNDAWYLGGIVSYSGLRSFENRLCNTKGYGAFTNVQSYLPWITSITGLRFEDNVCEVKDVDANAHYENLLPGNCGFYTPNRGPIFYFTASLFEYPWMAILHTRNKDGRPQDCEGSLINNRYVLTAAQCVEQNNLPFQVRLGEHHTNQDKDCVTLDDETECAPPVQDFGIDCIVRHQNYSAVTKFNDIALIRLDREVTYDDHIRPICLPVTQSLKQQNPPGYIVSSWGDDWTLLETEVAPVNRSECLKRLSKKDAAQLLLQKGQHCAVPSHIVDVCYWNNGAPLGMSARYKGMRFVQFGIVSFAISGHCNQWTSFVYTWVADYMDWVKANLRP